MSVAAAVNGRHHPGGARAPLAEPELLLVARIQLFVADPIRGEEDDARRLSEPLAEARHVWSHPLVKREQTSEVGAC